MPGMRLLRFRSIFRLIPAWGGLVLLLFLHIPALADVWAFIDDKGTAHFAAEQVD